jgi:DNA-directed RNA polymerase subunit M/transcription elongation factor TFIIS
MARKDWTKEEYNAYYREYMRRRYHEKRKEMITHLGGKCARCGSEKDLQIDHIDRAKKTMKVPRMAYVNNARRMEELKNCQLLCGPCHNEKTVVEDLGRRFSDHGTYVMYVNKKCRCDACKSAMREYNRSLRIRKGVKPRSKADHGTASMYGYHKCRCDVCRAGNTERGRAFRERARSRVSTSGPA